MSPQKTLQYTAFLYFLLCCLSLPSAQSTIFRIAEGHNRIQEAVSVATSGDTLMLTTSGGHYREDNHIALRRKSLTIIADPACNEKPVWTTKDTRIFRVDQNITLQGLRFDGQNTTDYGIRSIASEPNQIYIKNCIFENFIKDAITDRNSPIALCDIQNTIFKNIGATALEFRTKDACRELRVKNSTFQKIGEQAIVLTEGDFPVSARIQNVTIYDAAGGIDFRDVSLGEVSQSIITHCRVFGIRSRKPAMLINICTYKNWEDFDGVEPSKRYIQKDPLFFDPQNGNFALLPDSPCIKNEGHTWGDSRWAGEASIQAGNQYWIDFLINTAGLGLIVLFGVGGLVWGARTHAQRQSETALKESESKYRDLFESAHDIILIANKNGEIQDINQRGATLTQYDHQTLLALNLIDDLTVEADRPILRDSLQKAALGEDSIFEVQWLTAQNTQVYLEGAITPRMTDANQFIAARFIFRDITERRQTERELIRLERLKSLGEMAAGVSHNLNNILSGVLLPAEILQQEVTSPKAQKYINAIKKSGQRATDLVSRLHASVRGTNQNLKGVEINDIIQDAVKVTQPRWKDQAEADGHTIIIELDLQDVPTVSGTETGLLEITTNLIRNAIDALPKGGTITIRTELVNYRVGLSIRDTGVGMNEDTRSRVFEPFFTTKMDVGTGLGLSTVYGTITRWGGFINVISAPGKGTTFKIELPLWLEKTQKQQEQTPPTPSNQRRRILIVDDEEIIRTTLHQVLSENHDVITCDNGTSAMAHMQAEHFDVGLIDFGLPEQRGDTVAQALKTTNPKFVTILMTGWRLQDDDPRLDVFDFYIRKPFIGSDDIQNTLSKALILYDQRQSNIGE